MSDKDDIVSECGKDTFSLNGSGIIGIHMKERKLDPHIMKSQFQGIKYLTVVEQGEGSKTISFYKKNKRMPICLFGVRKDFLHKAKSSNYKGWIHLSTLQL